MSLRFSTEEAKQVALLKVQHPDRIPVKLWTGPGLQLQDGKNKFMFPKAYCVTEMLCAVRKRMPSLHSSESLFLHLDGGQLPCPHESLQQLFCSHNQDGILHMHLSKENTFGSRLSRASLFGAQRPVLGPTPDPPCTRL